jgi:hypothetical protein
VHHAFITVFQILAGENWPAVMYDGVRATGWLGILYFIAWVVLGQFILLNLFLAVLMDNFDKIGKDASGEADAEKARAQEKRKMQKEAKRARRLKTFKRRCKQKAKALAKRIAQSQQRIARLERRVHDLRVLLRTHRANEEQITMVLQDMRDELAHLKVIKATVLPTPSAMMHAEDMKEASPPTVCYCYSEECALVVASRKIIGNPWSVVHVHLFCSFFLSLI